MKSIRNDDLSLKDKSVKKNRRKQIKVLNGSRLRAVFLSLEIPMGRTQRKSAFVSVRTCH